MQSELNCTALSGNIKLHEGSILSGVESLNQLMAHCCRSVLERRRQMSVVGDRLAGKERPR